MLSAAPYLLGLHTQLVDRGPGLCPLNTETANHLQFPRSCPTTLKLPVTNRTRRTRQQVAILSLSATGSCWAPWFALKTLKSMVQITSLSRPEQRRLLIPGSVQLTVNLNDLLPMVPLHWWNGRLRSDCHLDALDRLLLKTVLSIDLSECCGLKHEDPTCLVRESWRFQFEELRIKCKLRGGGATNQMMIGTHGERGSVPCLQEAGLWAEYATKGHTSGCSDEGEGNVLNFFHSNVKEKRRKLYIHKVKDDTGQD
nr:uncharacterized protein LOC109152048 [Ipomoea batatas]